MEHPQSMNFTNQKLCVILRDTKGWPWSKIAERLHTLQGRGHHPSPRQCRDVYKAFSKKLGRRRYKYQNCGRKAWQVTPDIERFLVRRLLAMRTRCICTSTTLQRVLLQERNVQLEASTIRKILKKKGYRWLPRRQKPKYSKEVRAQRRQFAAKILGMTKRDYAKHFAMSMDGVVLALPPVDPVARENFCHVGETHMWRTRSEAAHPDLAGDDLYKKQLPYSRAVPMWGGIGFGGFGLVMFHARKKVDTDEWVRAVDGGRLVAACHRARPDRDQGPWHILCDNERFLGAPASRAAHTRVRVQLCHVPPRSPDLNPVELFWGWLRKRLQKMDLADLQAGREPVDRMRLKARVRSLAETRRAKMVARHCFLSLPKTCEKVRRKRGAASGS